MMSLSLNSMARLMIKPNLCPILLGTDTVNLLSCCVGFIREYLTRIFYLNKSLTVGIAE